MKILFAAVVLFCATLPLIAQKINVEIHPGADLSKYKTYNWTKGTPAKNPIVNQQIIDTIEKQLALKGLTKVEANADLSILFWATSGADLHVSYADWGWAPVAGRQIGIPIDQAWSVTKGTLEVDIFERESLSLLWRGTATDTLKHAPTNNVVKDAKDAEKQVRKAIEKLFKKFPKG